MDWRSHRPSIDLLEDLENERRRYMDLKIGRLGSSRTSTWLPASKGYSHVTHISRCSCGAIQSVKKISIATAMSIKQSPSEIPENTSQRTTRTNINILEDFPPKERSYRYTAGDLWICVSQIYLHHFTKDSHPIM